MRRAAARKLGRMAQPKGTVPASTPPKTAASPLLPPTTGASQKASPTALSAAQATVGASPRSTPPPAAQDVPKNGSPPEEDDDARERAQIEEAIAEKEAEVIALRQELKIKEAELNSLQVALGTPVATGTLSRITQNASSTLKALRESEAARKTGAALATVGQGKGEGYVAVRDSQTMTTAREKTAQAGHSISEGFRRMSSAAQLKIEELRCALVCCLPPLPGATCSALTASRAHRQPRKPGSLARPRRSPSSTRQQPRGSRSNRGVAPAPGK